MYFNEKKYKNCISKLIDIKIFIIIAYLIIFISIGVMASYKIMEHTNHNWIVTAIGVGTGAIVGLLLGCYSTWEIEMKIQEAYWKIDVITELKKQTNNSNKQNPIAKTVVAIENKQVPPANVQVTEKEIN